MSQSLRFTLTFAVVLVACFAVGAVCLAFAEASWDIQRWSPTARAFVAAGAPIAAIYTAVVREFEL